MLSRIQKIITTILTLIIIVSCIPTSCIISEASSTSDPVWVETSYNVFNLSGTDIVATLKNSTLSFTGNGRLPDYTLRNYRTKPWNGKYFSKVEIAETISYIGTYEFYSDNYIKDVDFYLSTFVADRTTFQELNAVRYRIKGTNISTVYYGKLPYTSLNSIQFMAYNQAMGQAYIFDTKQIASMVQNSSSPSIVNVYSVTEAGEPWLDVKANGNGYKINDCISISKETPMKDAKITSRIFFPTKQVYEIISSAIGEYEYGFTFDIAVTRLDKYDMKNTLYNYQYVLTLPKEYQDLKRTYRIMQISATGIKELMDVDFSDTTVTFITNEPTNTYVLVYK